MAYSRKKLRAVTMVFAVTALLALAACGSVSAGDPTRLQMMGGWQPGPEAYHPSRVIVRFSDAVSADAAVDSMQRLGYSLYRVASFEATAAFPGGARFGIVELPPEEGVDNAITKLAAAPGILYAERDPIHYPSQTPMIPDDPFFERLWGLHNDDLPQAYKDPQLPGNPVNDADIDMPEAWEVYTGSGDMIVAVIDTGCYIDHLDLAQNIWTNPGEIPGNGIDDDGNGYVDDTHGWDFYNNDNSVFDPGERDRYDGLSDQHGTHVAGTIGAVSNNNAGITGINWNIQIMPLKFIGPRGGATSDAILALEYAAQKGALVANCSWGGGPYSRALKDAIEMSGMLVVCAAGNEGNDNDVTPHYPSNYDSENIISVAASMQNDEPCNYPGWWSTCYGAQSVDLFAPGGYILSTVSPDPPVEPGEPAGEAYDFYYGTSMATPHVTGAAALMMSCHPELPPYPGAEGWVEGNLTIKEAILGAVDKKPAFDGKVVTGGRLNAARALNLAVPPLIKSVNASPVAGAPPLAVTFSATVDDPADSIEDVWWDFGDGSPQVYSYAADHVYEELGVYTAEFHVIDKTGYRGFATVRIKVFFPPEIEVSPVSLNPRLNWGEWETQEVVISNAGTGDLTYRIEVGLTGLSSADAGSAMVFWDDGNDLSPMATGGPDRFGYTWIDSDDPEGPKFRWQDIAQTGTELTLGDDDSAVVDLPFTFPFYGETKTQIRISSNGYLTFGPAGSAWMNATIPTAAAPNDLLAMFWENLNPTRGGKIYYYGDASVFVVQYEQVARSGVGGPYTFEAILTPDGTIVYQYLTMPGAWVPRKGTVGIENSTGTDGLLVTHNKPYIHDELAVMFVPVWISAAPVEGTVGPGESHTIDVTFVAGQRMQGYWRADLDICSNDIDRPKITIETALYVNSLIPPDIKSLTATPWAGSAPLTVDFAADVDDCDGEIVRIVWDFGDGSAPIEGGLTARHVYQVEGDYVASLTLTDDDGLSSTRSVNIMARPIPNVNVDPPILNAAVRAHRTAVDMLTITNSGDADLTFTAAALEKVDQGQVAAPEGSGGPDKFGYIWLDSDELGGPMFEWVDITSNGTFLSGLTSDEYVQVDLPWEFPFYGQLKEKVNVSADGHLTFGAKGTSSYRNTLIPYTGLPNDLLAAYWDDLRPAGGGGVYYLHDQENDRFIVQYDRVPKSWNAGSYTFEVILYPNGTILYQYLDMTFGTETAKGQGTIGIENATGTDGLQVLYNKKGYMHNELAIKFCPVHWISVGVEGGTLAPGASMDLPVLYDLEVARDGELNGAVVIESNDALHPRVTIPAHVDVIPNQPPVITGCSVSPERGPVATEFQFAAAADDSDGRIVKKYWDFGDGSDPVQDFVARHRYSAEGEYVATFYAIDNDGYRAMSSVVVTVMEPPSASWSPKGLALKTAKGLSVDGVVTLSNAGPGALIFGSGAAGSAACMPERLATPDTEYDLRACTARGLYQQMPDAARSEWLPDRVGNIIASWMSPSPIVTNWGVAVNRKTGELIIGSAIDGFPPRPGGDFVVTPDGVYTGKGWDTPWAWLWAADLTFDGTHVWQVNIGGDNGIYRMDPYTGEVAASITDGEWTEEPQRGLAYNPDDDTFFIGGWEEDIIYRIKGLSWDSPGDVLEKWSMPVGIAGLAYHPYANVLVVSSNGSPDMIYFVDPAAHSIIAQFPHPAAAMLEFSGAGIDLDADGNLWVASQANNTMYLVETGLGPMGGWLSWSPKNGTVPAGASREIVVSVDGSQLAPGTYTGNAVLLTNDTEYPMIIIPVTAEVVRPPAITEARAEPAVGEPPLEVAFHAEFEAPDTPVVSFGWEFGDGSSSPELDAVHVYDAQGTYNAAFVVRDQLGAEARASFTIDVRLLPHASVDLSSIEMDIPINAVETREVVISNADGHADLHFTARVRSGPSPVKALPERTGFASAPDSRKAEGMCSPIAAEDVEKLAALIQPDEAGDVILSWPAPWPIATAWGVGYDGENVWIGDQPTGIDYIVTPTGVQTGVSFRALWAEAWPADMAYDSNHGLMWQVNVGGDNGIYGLDPKTGNVVSRIVRGEWTFLPQRGLAYCDEDDTFYIGGWNEDIIYHIKGLDWDQPGAVLDKWSFPATISGLAWHPNGTLWVAGNSEPDMLYAVDPSTHAVLRQFPHPAGLNYSSGGLAIHEDGNLWVPSQDDNRIYLVNSAMPLSSGIVVEPGDGTVAAGDSQVLSISLNAAELGSPGGRILKHVEIRTNDPLHPVLHVGVTVNIEPGPTIVGAKAEPAIGEPPLLVLFAAEVEPGAAAIEDVWWDFGDGSEPVRSLSCRHTYTVAGVYEASLRAVDENGAEAVRAVTIQVQWLPAFDIAPSEFDKVVPAGGQDQDALTISNTGNAPMSFRVTPSPSFAGSPEWQEFASKAYEKGTHEHEPVGFAGSGAGGPDEFGYIWMDSSQRGGPEFDWFEISEIGTRILLDNEGGRTVPLPFGFPFYGSVKTQLGISSNGYLCFDLSELRAHWMNTPIPCPDKPNDMIAVFWDDLNPGIAGGVYYYYDEPNERFIVEFKDVPSWADTIGSPSVFTFQAILSPDGSIVCQYLSMKGMTASATIGIENAAGDDGLQVVYNAPYVEDGLAVAFSPVGSVLKVNPGSGEVLPGKSQDVAVTFGSPQAAPGTYTLRLYVSTNDPFRPSAVVPVRLKLNVSPVADLLLPAGGETWAGKQEIKWSATDPDDAADALTIDLYWSRDGGEWNEIAKGLANTGSHVWNTASVGLGGDDFRVRIVVTDPAGQAAEIISEPFTISNEVPMAAFSYSPLPATVTSPVEFVDESTDDGEITAWHWEFGDGAESYEQNPKHQYSAKGQFTVKLTVTDNGGLTGVCEKQIQVVNVAPTVRIISPSAGETWTRAREIEYEASDADGDPLTIRLEYDYLGDEAGWQPIAEGQENTGKFLWDISKLAKGGRYKVRIAAADPDGGTADAVSGEFTIIVLKHMVMAAPNPARNSVTFYYDIESDATIYVYDVAGRLVYSAGLAVGTDAHEWNLTTGDRPLAAGLYLYAVVTVDGMKSEVGRLVIER